MEIGLTAAAQLALPKGAHTEADASLRTQNWRRNVGVAKAKASEIF